ncbi:hypothetical protein NQ318_012513 [Aromia moschata]|uniref:Uncharacterized protein n=1 Tax=Aromia moschata TaxID=1265417 RepID=A0AAV8XE01_9CUCU|nr:hypothetical protein NQ318_012513 [Aromia moschata]
MIEVKGLFSCQQTPVVEFCFDSIFFSRGICNKRRTKRNTFWSGLWPSCDLPLGDLSLPLPEFLLDEALRLVELDDEASQETTINLKDLENLSLDPTTAESANSSVTPSLPTESETANQADGIPSSPDTKVAKDAEDDLDLFADMIQTPQFHHPHHRAAFQSRMPFVRTVSMEQRWQDLANLLSLPSPADGSGIHHPFSHHHPALHNYSHPHHHPHPHGMGYSAETTRGFFCTTLHSRRLWATSTQLCHIVI